MWEPVTHIARGGGAVALCDAPLEAAASRAEDPEEATCAECVATYLEGSADVDAGADGDSSRARAGAAGAVPSGPFQAPDVRQQLVFALLAVGVGLALLAVALVLLLTR